MQLGFPSILLYKELNLIKVKLQAFLTSLLAVGFNYKRIFPTAQSTVRFGFCWFLPFSTYYGFPYLFIGSIMKMIWQ